MKPFVLDFHPVSPVPFTLVGTLREPDEDRGDDTENAVLREDRHVDTTRTGVDSEPGNKRAGHGQTTVTTFGTDGPTSLTHTPAGADEVPPRTARFPPPSRAIVATYVFVDADDVVISCVNSKQW